MKLKLSFPILIILFVSLGFISCKTTKISDLSPENGVAEIKQNYKNEDWISVINDVNEFKSRYPYSAFNIETSLMQGDSYFQSGQYAEAISTYDNFVKKNPTNENVPFATYRIGQCYDIQAPNNIDRDQANTKKAIAKYQELIERFPNSDHIKEANERSTILKRRLFDHDSFVANFYWQKGLYAGALSRYLEIIHETNFPDLLGEAKSRAHDCYLELAKILKAYPDSDAYVYFKNETPESLTEKANEISK